MTEYSSVRLIYFDIRGLAEPIRWMLKMSGVEFTDERIALDSWAVRKRSSLDDLQKRRGSGDANKGLKSKFVPQFPVLVMGEDFAITQPLTVLRFVARKFGYNGETALEEARADEASDLIYDLRLRAVDFEGTAFKSSTPDIVRHTVFRDLRKAPEGPKKQKMKDEFINIWFPLYFMKFNDLLETSDGEWIAGPNMTYGDLTIANFLDIAEDLVDPNCLAEFPKLKELKEKVMAIPEIAEFRKQQNLLKVDKEKDNVEGA